MERSFSLRALVMGVTAVSLIACGKADSTRTQTKEEGPAKPVAMVRAQVKAMPRTIMAVGTLAARENSMLRAKVSGRLQELPVDVGSVVRKGDLLAQVEPRDYELALRQAEAALAEARAGLGLDPEGTDDRVDVLQVSAVKQAKAVLEEASRNRERVKSLSQSQIASPAELDSVEATLTVAATRYQAALEEARSRVAALGQRRVEYEMARKRLADASVRAPFDGIVQSRPANPGEYVAVGAAMVELVQLDPLRLRLQVTERECSLVQTGQVVHLFVEGDTNRYEGRIARLSPALNEQTRMLQVEADVPAQGTLRAGLFARARIMVREQEEALSVPAEALVTFAGLEKVVLVKEGKAVEKVVTTGRREQGWVEILSGLGAVDEVVAKPMGLRTGQAVVISAGAEEKSVAPKTSGKEKQGVL